MPKSLCVVYGFLFAILIFLVGIKVGYTVHKIDNQPPENVFLENIQSVVYYINDFDGKINLLKLKGVYPKNQQVYDVVYSWFENEPKIFHDIEKDKLQFAKGLKTYWGLKDFEVHLHKIEPVK